MLLFTEQVRTGQRCRWCWPIIGKVGNNVVVIIIDSFVVTVYSDHSADTDDQILRACRTYILSKVRTSKTDDGARKNSRQLSRKTNKRKKRVASLKVLQLKRSKDANFPLPPGVTNELVLYLELPESTSLADDFEIVQLSTVDFMCNSLMSDGTCTKSHCATLIMSIF